MKRLSTALLGVVCVHLPIAGYAADSGGIRPYVVIRAEGAIYDKSDQGPNLKTTNPSQYPFEHFAVGANIGPNWGAELAIDFVETNVGVPGLTDRLGEYATWSVMPQVRYRYPLLDKKLVPYVVGGVGIGIGEFNDRNALHTNVQFGGSQDIAPIAALGAGLEYFMNDNIAFGVEAKHVFGQKHDVTYLGQSRTLDMDQTILSVGFRVFLDNPSVGDSRSDGPAPVNYTQARNFYTQFRTGGAIFTNADNFTPAEIQNPQRIFFGVGAGYNINDHWGLELGGDYWEPELRAPGVGAVAEYALWTLLAHVRYRFQVGDSRLVPYALVGGGLGWAQINDKRVPSDVYPLVAETHTSVVGSVGGGVEYMLNRYAAIGIESRYIFGFNNDVVVGSTKGTLDNNSVLVLAQIRLLFP